MIFYYDMSWYDALWISPPASLSAYYLYYKGNGLRKRENTQQKGCCRDHEQEMGFYFEPLLPLLCIALLCE